MKYHRSAAILSVLFAVMLSSPIMAIITQTGDYHSDHLNDPSDIFPNDYMPMTVPGEGYTVIMKPQIMCTSIENGVFMPHYHPCKSAQTHVIDNEWSDNDANYTYFFEDWTDYDWNDIVVSLYTSVQDIIETELRLEDREATWRNPLGVELTSSFDVEIHWNSTDYPEEHIVNVNSGETVTVELFYESNVGDAASIQVIPLISPVASFVYSPPLPEEGQAVTFDASASLPRVGTIINYEWNFGDGKFGTGETLTHTYKDDGIYQVTLNVTNSAGEWDTESKQIVIKPRPPPPVGGTAMPIILDQPGLSASLFGLALPLLFSIGLAIILIRRGKQRLE